MHGVAAAEYPAFGVAFSDHVVDLPLAGGQHFNRYLGIADNPPGPLDHRRLTQVWLALGRVVHEQHHPLIPGPHTDKGAAAHPVIVAGLHHPVENTRTAFAVLTQIGPQPDVDRASQTNLALQRDAQQLHHPAARTVRADHVLRPHSELAPGASIEYAGGYAVSVLGEVQQFVVEAHFATGAQRFIGQNRFHQVLGDVAHRRRAGQFIVRLALDGVTPGQQAPQLLAAETGGPDVIGHQFVGTCSGDHLWLDPGIAKNFHGALIGDVRTRAIGSPAVLVDQQVANAIARQQQGGCQAGRAAADNQHRDFDDFRRILQIHNITPHSCSWNRTTQDPLEDWRTSRSRAGCQRQPAKAKNGR
ncbi:hypothetical protein D3C77_280000 [compost metagenome]